MHVKLKKIQITNSTERPLKTVKKIPQFYSDFPRKNLKFNPNYGLK